MAGITLKYDLGPHGVEDMINLPDLSEGALLWNLRTRYEKEFIYTYTGSILVAANPYRFFDVYGQDMVKKYSGQVLGTLPPHLFAIGNEAYLLMQKQEESQVVIISGESGAGKTESTKLLLRYLAAVNRSGNDVITEQIVEASPLLESFGNAKTTRNDNSSRFGKYVEVKYKGGSIEGAKISQYLLEKSRVVTHGQDERSYHVFYEMLSGMDPKKKERYGLKTANDYFYLNQGGLAQMSLKNDREDFGTLVAAMDIINFTNEERDTIFSILAAVLHMGNVFFKRKLSPEEHYVEVGDCKEVTWVSQLLQLNEDWLMQGMTMKVTEARQERLLTPFTMEQAVDTRDAISKGLYSYLFEWLVHRVNNIICRDGKHCSIAILDIFGFEDFAKNSFEQLCINYANETLQYYFNKHIFKLEQIEYEKENIKWSRIDFEDNQPTINMIAKKPSGIIHLLDDESNFPKGTDTTFLDKCHYNHSDNPLYSKPRMSAPQFIIKHYAGKLTYTVTNFVEKNKDTLRNDVLDLMCQSGNTLIAGMFREAREKKTIGKSTGRYMNMKPRVTTVAASFHESLLHLIDTMSKCNPFFVRCVKPNNHKSPMQYDMEVVLDQLRYTGMLETIKIRKMGYPVRLRYNVFVARHHFLLVRQKVADLDVKKYSALILKQSGGMYDQHFQLGKTKVFMKESYYKKLEIQTKRCMVNALVRVQKHVRGYIVRKNYLKRRNSSIIIQKYYRMYAQRTKYQKIRHAYVKVQALCRMRRQRRRYIAMRDIARRKKVEEERKKRLEEKKAKERVQPVTTNVHQLEIPAQLAMLYSMIDDWQSIHTDRNISAHVGKVAEPDVEHQLPVDINMHTMSKMVNVLFKTNRRLGVTSEPVTEPFLVKPTEADVQESLMIFKLILRFMNDTTLTAKRELLLGDYIVQKGISNLRLRDEIYCQLINQTWRNGNQASLEKGWLLMAACLSAFPPSALLYKYLLKYVSDHAYNGYKCLCQYKLLQCSVVEYPLSRHYPPTMLEWRTHRQKAHMALHLHYSDGTIGSASVDSWTTCEDLASYIISQNRNIADSLTGWSVCLREPNRVYEAGGYEFILDLIGEIEVPAHFPCLPADFLVSQTRARDKSKSVFENTPHNPEHPRVYAPDTDYSTSGAPLLRSQAVFVANPQQHVWAGQEKRISSAMVATPFVQPMQRSRRPTSAIYEQNEPPTPPPINKSFSSQDLSTKSKLNDRYFSRNPQSPQNRPFDQNARDKIQRRLRKQSSISERSEMDNSSEMSQFIDEVFDGVLSDGQTSELRDSAAMMLAMRGFQYGVQDGVQDGDLNNENKDNGSNDFNYENNEVIDKSKLKFMNTESSSNNELDRFLSTLTDDFDAALDDLCSTDRLVPRLQGGGAGVKDEQNQPRTTMPINLPNRPISTRGPTFVTNGAATSPTPVSSVQSLFQQQKLNSQHIAGQQNALLQAAVQQQALQNELLQQTLQGELLKQQLYQVQNLNQTNQPPQRALPQASVAPRVPNSKSNDSIKTQTPKRGNTVQISDKVETIPVSKTIIETDSGPTSPTDTTPGALSDGKSSNSLVVNSVFNEPSTSMDLTLAKQPGGANGSKVANLTAILAAKFSKSSDDISNGNRAKTVRVGNVKWPPRKDSTDGEGKKVVPEVGKLVIKKEPRRMKKAKSQLEMHEMTMQMIRSRSSEVSVVSDDSSLCSVPTSPIKSDQQDSSTHSRDLKSRDGTASAPPKLDMRARAAMLEAALSARSSSVPSSTESSPEKSAVVKRSAPNPPPLRTRNYDNGMKL